MRKLTVSITLLAIIAVTAIVYAGEGFSMKCRSKTCGYESEVIFGGGMAFQQLTGYCQACKKFVYLSWTLEGSPMVNPKAEKIPHPKALGEVLDVRTGLTLTIYACPHCKGPFAEIKAREDLRHCPVCRKPEFAVDETKPMMAID